MDKELIKNMLEIKHMFEFDNLKKYILKSSKELDKQTKCTDNNCIFCKTTETPESKEVKDFEFKVGDVVVLKSGGCDMTIEEILENNPEILKNTLVQCVYMNYMSKVERVTLSKNAIKKVKHVI